MYIYASCNEKIQFFKYHKKYTFKLKSKKFTFNIFLRLCNGIKTDCLSNMRTPIFYLDVYFL